MYNREEVNTPDESTPMTTTSHNKRTNYSLRVFKPIPMRDSISNVFDVVEYNNTEMKNDLLLGSENSAFTKISGTK